MMRKKGVATAPAAAAAAAASTMVPPQLRQLKHKPTATPQFVVLLVLGMAVAIFGLTLYKHHTHRFSTESLALLQEDTAVAAVLPVMAQKRGGGTKATTSLDKKAIVTTTTTTLAAKQATTQAKIDDIRHEFFRRYGGRETALQLYRQGIAAYGTPTATAERLLRILASSSPKGPSGNGGGDNSSKNKRRTLSLSFGGYSVTVGRGNHYSQSYPMVLRDILTPLLQSTVDVKVQVVNAAIGGIPSFPYGFCLPHFLGTSSSSSSHQQDDDPVHLISWDYSMNEPNGQASILEAYIRHAILATTTATSDDDAPTLSPPPLILVLDTNANRCALLQKYVAAGYLGDALCVGLAKDALRGTKYAALVQSAVWPLDEQPDDLPLGLQHWHDFGAAPSCPGRGNWHPKYQEHALIGWLIAMYFVDALEVALDIQSRNANWRTKYGTTTTTTTTTPQRGGGGGHPPNKVQFGPPMEAVPRDNHPNVTSLLYGHVVAQTSKVKTTTTTTGNHYEMHAVQCRTNFEPATDETNDLVSIVVSGLAPGAANAARDILTERSDELYASGWVVDVSRVERETKLKVEACGGLGYVDMKIALYGIPSSGPLQLWLPITDSATNRRNQHMHSNRDNDSREASRYVSELIVCEANEKRPKSACQLDTDLEYTVGGIVVATSAVSWIHGAAEYLKRPTCVHVGIPVGATATPWSSSDYLAAAAAAASSKTQRRRGAPDDARRKDELGLVVEIRVSNAKVTRERGACCVSHVVWESAAAAAS
jgi:hypothetical protein